MKLRVTYELVVDIEPIGLDDDEAEKQRAIGMVLDEPCAFVQQSNVSATVEWVDG